MHTIILLLCIINDNKQQVKHAMLIVDKSGG